MDDITDFMEEDGNLTNVSCFRQKMLILGREFERSRLVLNGKAINYESKAWGRERKRLMHRQM